MRIFKRGTTESGNGEAEAEIRDLVRRDRQRPANDGDMGPNTVDSLLQRVSLNSVQEIDRLIAELEMLKERLHRDSERLQRKIVDYAHLSQAAMQSSRIISESLIHRRKSPDAAAISD